MEKTGAVVRLAVRDEDRELLEKILALFISYPLEDIERCLRRLKKVGVG